MDTQARTGQDSPGETEKSVSWTKTRSHIISTIELKMTSRSILGPSANPVQ